jgi:peptidase E
VTDTLAEALEEFDHSLSDWARAYPETVFPEPDMDVVRTALEARGITIDSVSASNMRHVAKVLNREFNNVRAALAGEGTNANSLHLGKRELLDTFLTEAAKAGVTHLGSSEGKE